MDVPAERAAGSARDRLAAVLPARTAAPERGLPGWAALLVLLGIAGIGGAIDMISGTTVRGWFNIGIVVASLVAILVVRRSAMFPIVIAPPIVYSLGVRRHALHPLRRAGRPQGAHRLGGELARLRLPGDRRGHGSVLIVAGIRLIIRK